MSLNRGKINPLSVLGVRKLNFIPSHFSKLTFAHYIYVKPIDHWINYNLSGRYAVVTTQTLENNKIVNTLEIGFEDPKEITMFTLACPYIHI